MNITEFAMFKKMLGKGGGGGSTLPTGSVELSDQDYCGPYNVTYKTYENGNVVDKTVVLPVGGFEEVSGVIQGTVIEVSGGASISGVSFYTTEIGEFIDGVSKNGIAYIVFPNSVVWGMLTIMG